MSTIHNKISRAVMFIMSLLLALLAAFTLNAAQSTVGQYEDTGLAPQRQAAGAISLTLKDRDTNGPIALNSSITVRLYDSETPPGGYTPYSNFTNGDPILFDQLPVGDYTVLVGDEFDGPNQYILPEFYEGAAAAETAAMVSVSAGQTTAVTQTLKKGAVIQGKVLDSTGLVEIYDVSVTLHSTEEEGEIARSYVDDPAFFGDGNPDAGTFTFSGLREGAYIVEIDSYYGINEIGFNPTFYDSVSQWNQATPINATFNSTATVEARLRPEAVISGVVRDSKTTTPVPNIRVDAFTRYIDGDFVGRIVQGSTTTDENGSYTLRGLPEVGVFIGAFDGASIYLDQFFDGQSDILNAAVVTPSISLNISHDFALTAGGKVAASMLDDSGQPITNGFISIYDEDFEQGSSQRLTDFDEDGIFEISGLKPGEYILKFEPIDRFEDCPEDPVGCLVKTPYQTQYSGGATELFTAVSFRVEAEETVVIEESLRKGGNIEVTATAADTGDPLNVYYHLWTNNHSHSTDPFQSNGTGSFTNLTPGTYYLQVSYEQFPGENFFNTSYPYAAEYYNDQALYSRATPIDLDYGDDIQLNIQLDQAGALEGSVSSADDTIPLTSGEIKLYHPTAAFPHDRQLYAKATYSEDGQFTIDNLKPGQYFGRIFPLQNHDNTFYSGAAGVEYTPIEISGGQTTTLSISLDPSQPQGGTLSVKATDPEIDYTYNTMPLAVYKIPDSGIPTSVTLADFEQISFSFDEIPPGDYLLYVHLVNVDRVYQKGFYVKDGDLERLSGRIEAASVITIKSGEQTSVNITLSTETEEIGGNLIATLSPEDSDLRGLELRIKARDLFSFSSSDDFRIPQKEDGTFEVDNLPPGLYDVIPTWFGSTTVIQQQVEIKSGETAEIEFDFLPLVDINLDFNYPDDIDREFTFDLFWIDEPDTFCYPNGRYITGSRGNSASLVQSKTNYPGNYKVEISTFPYALSDLYGQYPNQALYFTFDPENPSQVDITLEESPSLSGVVTDENSNQPLPNATVVLYSSDNDEKLTAVGKTKSDSNGSYAFLGVQAGSYAIGIEPTAESNLVQQYYPGVRALKDAALIVFDSDEDQVVNLTSQLGGTLVGYASTFDPYEPNENSTHGPPPVYLIQEGGGEDLVYASTTAYGLAYQADFEDDDIEGNNNFVFLGIAPGRYYLQYGDYTSGHVIKYSGNAATPEAALRFDIVASETQVAPAVTMGSGKANIEVWVELSAFIDDGYAKVDLLEAQSGEIVATEIAYAGG
ncbi:MAG: carboxypeptidase-like regulatory domain-containing protein, partial [Chloroflexota bacterium]